MELFKRAVNDSNIKAQIKADLIKHLEDCKCGDKPRADKPKKPAYKPKFKAE